MAEGNFNELNGSPSQHIVYIDTSLDTRFALMVSDEDTVFDLKKKIISEHPQDFPKFGEIKIHSLKVKRKRYYYHLSNSMLVKSAFIGVNGRWYLSADASSLVEHIENHLPANLNSGNLLPSTYNPSPERNDPLLDGRGDFGRAVLRDLEKEVKHLSDDHVKILLSGTNKESDSEMLRKVELFSKENEVVGAHSEHKNGIHDIQCTNISGEYLRTDTPVKKKHKKRERNMDVHAALVSKGRLQAETINPGKFLGKAELEDVNDLEIQRKSLSAHTSKILDSSVLEKVDLSEGNEITEVVENEKLKTNGRIEDFRSEKSSGEDSQSGCQTKKWKIEKDNDTKDHTKQNEDSTSILIPANALIGQQKNINSIMDCLSTEQSEPQEDGHLLKGNSVDGKRKRRKKSVVEKHYQVGTGTSSMLENVTEENPKKTQEENTSREPDSVEKNYHPVQQEENGDMVSHLKLRPESDADGLIQNYSLDGLSTEPLDNASLSNTVGGKKKRGKKSLISHIKDAGVSSVKESVRNKISEENHEDEILYDRAVSMKANNSDAVQVGRETMVPISLFDVGIGEHDASLNGLSAEQIERSHSLPTVSGSKKKKRKKKSSDSLSQVEPAVPSSVEHDMEKSPKETQGQNTKANSTDPVRENEKGSIVHNSKAGIDMGAPEAGSLNKTVDATLEYLSAGPLDNSDMSTAVPTSGKKKRKKRSLDFHNQIDCTGPSVLENVRQDISKGSHEGNYGDLDTEAAALRLKKNHLDSVQEEEELETAVTHSEPGIDMCEEVDAGNLMNKRTTSTLEAESGGRKIKGTQKRHSSTEEDGSKFATEQIEKSEREMLLSSSKDHKSSPDGNEFGLCVGKKRKSTKAKNSDVKKQLATGIENDKQEAADVSPAEPYEALAGDLSDDEAKKKGENMTNSSKSKTEHASHLGSESATNGLSGKELEKTKGNRETWDEHDHLVVKKRKSKKTRSSIVKKQVTTENVSQEAGYCSPTEPHKALNGDISSNESKKEEKNMTNIWKIKALNVSHYGCESGTDELSREDPARKTKETLEHLDGKLGSKSNCPEIPMLMKQQDVYKETAASVEKLRAVESPSNSRWMNKLVNATSNKQVKTNLETEKEAGIETQSSPNLLSLQKKDETDELSRKDPARKIKENLEHLDGKLGSKSKCPEIPVLMKQQDVYKETAASAEKLREAESPSNSRWMNNSVKTTSNKQVKSNLETEKEAGMETKSASNLLSLQKKDETDELSRKDPARNKKENLEVKLGSKSKFAEITVLMKQQDVYKKTAPSAEKLREVEKPSNSRWMNKSVKTTSNKQVKSDLEIENEAGMETKSSPKLLSLQKKDENCTRFPKTTESGVKTVTSSRESALVSSKEKSREFLGMVEDGNAQNGNREMLRNNLTKHKGEVVNGPGRKKSLLAASGTIFKEDSSYSSEDEDGGVSDSDASEKTPSASSSSSDLSQGESGSTDVRSKGSGRGRNLIIPISSAEKNISIEMILRNSSQYKKAKLTASQSQLEDTESQPVDFVPDSQANL